MSICQISRTELVISDIALNTSPFFKEHSIVIDIGRKTFRNKYNRKYQMVISDWRKFIKR